MPATTSRLRLLYHTLADVFRIQDYADNWQALDANPGVFICTSGTQPSDWTSADDGRLIFETDTAFLRRYDHGTTSFIRIGGVGVLDTDSDTSVSTESGSFVEIVSVTVDVPGERPVMLTVTGNVGITDDPGELELREDSNPLFTFSYEASGPLAVNYVIENPSAGSTVYALFARRDGSTGSVSFPDIRISAVEL